MESGVDAFLDFLAVSAGWLFLANLLYIKPWFTFIINALGSFILGLAYGADTSIVNARLLLFIATGFCGSLTTFSTFAYDALLVFKAGNYGLAFLYIFMSVLAAILSALLGFFLSDAFPIKR